MLSRMVAWHRSRSVVLCGSLFFCLIGLEQTAWGQKNNKNTKAEEKREDQRVKSAQEKLQSAQKNLGELTKVAKTAAQAVPLAEKTVKAAREKVRDEKESAETRLDSKSGIPELIAELKVARAEFAKLADPIREKVHATTEWQMAEEAASEAKAQKQEILELVKDMKERSKQLEPIELLIAKPLELETTAIHADKAALAASQKVDRLKTKLDELRKKFPDSKIEEDPLVKKAKSSLEDADKKFQAAMREAQSAKMKVAKQNVAVAEAQQQLAKAKEADRRNK